MDVNGGQSHHVSHGGSRKSKFAFLSLKTAYFALLISIAVLILAVATFAALGSSSSQTRFVDGSKIQAVYISGQNTPYFGRVTVINEKIIRLTNIYYLQVTQPVQPKNEDTQDQGNIVLRKLGCEIHGPEDVMVINQESVIGWTNLSTDGPVAKLIKEVETKYNGDCKQIEAATQAASDAAKKENN